MKATWHIHGDYALDHIELPEIDPPDNKITYYLIGNKKVLAYAINKASKHQHREMFTKPYVGIYFKNGAPETVRAESFEGLRKLLKDHALHEE